MKLGVWNTGAEYYTVFFYYFKDKQHINASAKWIKQRRKLRTRKVDGLNSNNGRLLSDGERNKKKSVVISEPQSSGEGEFAELSGVIRIPVTVGPTSRQRKAEGGTGSKGSRGRASGLQEKLKVQREKRDEKRAGREVKEFRWGSVCVCVRACVVGGEGLIHILFQGIAV